MSLILTNTRVVELKKLFGKQNFIYYDEFKTYAWVVEHNNCQGIIFSSEGKGTSLEIILNKNGIPFGSIEDFYNEYINVMFSFT